VSRTEKLIEINSLKETTVDPAISRHVVGHVENIIPICGKLASFRAHGYPMNYGETGSEVVAVGFSDAPEKILGVGCDPSGGIVFLLA